MKNLYITGLAGFLGKNLLSILPDDVNIIAFILSKERDIPHLQKDNITLVEGNILNKEDVYKFLNIENEDKYIIHMAGRITTIKKHDNLTMDINYTGTKNIVDVAIDVGGFKKLIYISSVDSMPLKKEEGLIEEVSYYDINRVEGVYSKSKVLANNYILDYADKLPSTLILPSALVGPNDPTLTPINKAIYMFLHHKLPAITKGGYNLVDVRDVAYGIYQSIEKGRNKESYLLAGSYISVKDLINKVALLTNRKPLRFCIPHIIIKIISPFIELQAKIKRKTPLFTAFSMDCLMQNSSYSSLKANKELSYQSRDIDDTLKDTVKFLLER